MVQVFFGRQSKLSLGQVVQYSLFLFIYNCISGVIGICSLFTKKAAIRRKINDWLAQNQENVSESSDMSNLLSQ